jgi:serine/threonine protein phosphatase PrpC
LTSEHIDEPAAWRVNAGGRMVVGQADGPADSGGADMEPEAVVMSRLTAKSAQYRPDSAVDGWRADPFVVRAASVRGDAHRYRGVPRQDDMSLVWSAEGALLVIAVADGVSLASHSHLGASTACRYAVDIALRGSGPTEPAAWTELLRACAWGLVDLDQRLEALPEPDPQRTEELLATTLCIVTVTPDAEGATVRAASVGDSGVAVISGDEIVPLLGGKAPPADGIVDSGVAPLPRLAERPASGEWQLFPDETLLVGTDGIWDAVGDGSGTVGRYLVHALGSSLPGRADFLRLVDFYRDTYDDDRTLVAVRVDSRSAGPGDGQRQRADRENDEAAEQDDLGTGAHVPGVHSGDDG